MYSPNRIGHLTISNSTCWVRVDIQSLNSDIVLSERPCMQAAVTAACGRAWAVRQHNVVICCHMEAVTMPVERHPNGSNSA
jgi:hypothetical protein